MKKKVVPNGEKKAAISDIDIKIIVNSWNQIHNILSKMLYVVDQNKNTLVEMKSIEAYEEAIKKAKISHQKNFYTNAAITNAIANATITALLLFRKAGESLRLRLIDDVIHPSLQIPQIAHMLLSDIINPLLGIMYKTLFGAETLIKMYLDIVCNQCNQFSLATNFIRNNKKIFDGIVVNKDNIKLIRLAEFFLSIPVSGSYYEAYNLYNQILFPVINVLPHKKNASFDYMKLINPVFNSISHYLSFIDRVPYISFAISSIGKVVTYSVYAIALVARGIYYTTTFISGKIIRRFGFEELALPADYYSKIEFALCNMGCFKEAEDLIKKFHLDSKETACNLIRKGKGLSFSTIFLALESSVVIDNQTIDKHENRGLRRFAIYRKMAGIDIKSNIDIKVSNTPALIRLTVMQALSQQSVEKAENELAKFFKLYGSNPDLHAICSSLKLWVMIATHNKNDINDRDYASVVADCFQGSCPQDMMYCLLEDLAEILPQEGALNILYRIPKHKEAASYKKYFSLCIYAQHLSTVEQYDKFEKLLNTLLNSRGLSRMAEILVANIAKKFYLAAASFFADQEREYFTKAKDICKRLLAYKVPFSDGNLLLDLGMIQYQLDENNEAASTFDILHKRYPNFEGLEEFKAQGKGWRLKINAERQASSVSIAEHTSNQYSEKIISSDNVIAIGKVKEKTRGQVLSEDAYKLDLIKVRKYLRQVSLAKAKEVEHLEEVYTYILPSRQTISSRDISVTALKKDGIVIKYIACDENVKNNLHDDKIKLKSLQSMLNNAAGCQVTKNTNDGVEFITDKKFEIKLHAWGNARLINNLPPIKPEGGKGPELVIFDTVKETHQTVSRWARS